VSVRVPSAIELSHFVGWIGVGVGVGVRVGVGIVGIAIIFICIVFCFVFIIAQLIVIGVPRKHTVVLIEALL